MGLEPVEVNQAYAARDVQELASCTLILLQLRLLHLCLPGKAPLHPDDGPGKGVLPW